jgi:hypothetical protein
MKYTIITLLVFLSFTSCDTKTTKETNNNDTNETIPEKEIENRDLSAAFKDYWFNGTAEVSSYTLNQARYGAMREGTAVLIFVTEDFDKKDQVKAYQKSNNTRPVLKLNAIRDFKTGIYPYHIMSSTFLPLDKKENAVKIATSIQEWCGHTYMQLNHRDDIYQVSLFSYFQNEGNKEFEIDNVITENQLAAQLRLDPIEMPTGDLKIIPSTEYLRLKHVTTKAYKATAKLNEMEDGYVYSVKFTELNRTIAFKTEKTFPYRILSWMDRYEDGGAPMVTTGTLNKTIKTAYWNQNTNKDTIMRDSLGL